MKINKIFATLLPVTLGLSPVTALFATTSCSSGYAFKEKDVKLYTMQGTNYINQKLYFSDEYTGIPFIDLADGAALLNKIYSINDPKASVVSEISGNTFKYTRENKASITFNFDFNTIYSEDIAKFSAGSHCLAGLDVNSTDPNWYDAQGKKIEGQVKFVTPKSNIPDTTKPQPMFQYLSDYYIRTYRQGDKFLIPFTTWYNICGYTTISIAFNGQDLFVMPRDIPNEEYKNLYYSFPQQARSKKLREYNYNELVRTLDYGYGLKDEHHISDFDTFMKDNGLKDLLLSESRYDEDKAYSLLQYTYFADEHSGFTYQNAYGGYSYEELVKIANEIPKNSAYIQRIFRDGIRKQERKNYNVLNDAGTVTKAVQQTDDTLILTFDHFTCKDPNFYYSDQFDTELEKIALAEAGDTVAIVSYANDRILSDIQSGSPTIKNVVIDLTANGGGSASAALFVLGWLGSATAQIYDSINKNYCSIQYDADVNFDKKIDEKDRLVAPSPALANGYTGKVYCLTSDRSFSCGNFVPAMLKQSQLAKIVGTKSGGGACVVHVNATADGSGICFSSKSKLCYCKNGSYYSIDEGIEPDYYLSDYEILYKGDQSPTTEPSNRKELVKFIGDLK